MNIDENILVEEIKHFIETNNYQKDDKLPSERTLSTSFSVSRSLIRKALISLVDMGYLYVKDKSGYYFNGNKKGINLKNSYDTSINNDFKYSVITTKRIKNKKIAKRMNISEDSNIIQAITLAKDNNQNNSVMSIYLYSPSLDTLNDDVIFQTINTTFLNSTERKGQIYSRDANDFELQLMDFDKEVKVYRWSSLFVYKENIVLIEHSLNLEEYEFLGW